MIDSPLGELQAAATKNGLCMLEYVDAESSKEHFSSFTDYTRIENSEYPLFVSLKAQLAEYFDSSRTEFDIPFDLIGTDFQKRVWSELLNVGYGKTRTYQEQSIALDDVKAIRAVASANGRNKIPILIPCHRIIGTNGSLTGYAGDLWRKKFLLELESNQASLF
jgi:methylated-DNA-[protein]-cysteine S-methyltransferase